jgi:hypothetical protein
MWPEQAAREAKAAKAKADLMYMENAPEGVEETLSTQPQSTRI